MSGTDTGTDTAIQDPMAVATDEAKSHHPSEDIKDRFITPSDATFTVTNDTVIVAIKLPNVPLCHKDLPDMRLTFRSMEEVNPSDMAGRFNEQTTPDEEVTCISSEAESQAPVRDDEYYLNLVNFEFDDVEFLVPRWRFHETSQDSTLILPREDENRAYTQADVSASDFRGLMEFMYPMPSEDLSRGAWISVLKLASGWHMIQYRKKALEEIERWPNTQLERGSFLWSLRRTYSLQPEEKVVLGRQCGIPAWYRQGCIAFAQGDSELEVQHEAMIGIDAMVKILRARDATYAHVFDTYHKEFPAPSTFLRDAQTDLPLDGEVGPSTSQIVEEICMARKNGLDSWLRACYGQLIDHRDSITLEEITLVGLETTLSLWKARLRLLKHYHRTLEASCVLPLDFTTCVEGVFSQELADIQLLQNTFDPPAPPLPIQTRAWGSALVGSNGWGSPVGGKKYPKKKGAKFSHPIPQATS